MCIRDRYPIEPEEYRVVGLAVQPMSGSFVAMDEDACAVYSLSLIHI